MGVEVALALAVLLAAALFWRSFSETRDADPGFKREGVLLANYDFSGPQRRRAGGPRRSRRGCSSGFARCPASRRRRSRPPCRSTSTACRSARSRSKAARAARAAPDRALTNTVTPGYLRTMGIPLRGRDRFRRPARRRGAAAGDRERGVRPPLSRRRRSRSAAASRAAARATRSPASRATRPTIRSARRRSPVIYLSYRDRPSARGEIHLRTRAGAESLLAPEVRARRAGARSRRCRSTTSGR